LVYPPGAYKTPAPGDLKRLLDPRNDPAQRPAKLPPLPAYPLNSLKSGSAGVSAPPAIIPQQSQPPASQWLDAPSNVPLPLLPPPMSNPGAVPNVQETAPRNAPIYVPQSSTQEGPASQPVLVEQSATQDAVIQPATNTTQTAKPARNGSRARVSSNPPSYTGRMNLPPSEENVDSTDAGAGMAPVQAARQSEISHPSQTSSRSNAPSTLRIASQPMDSMAAQVQAQFAEQTDSQLTQGSATTIHALTNAPVNSAASLNPYPAGQGLYTATQYTPSAQEAATGAYSAPRQQTQQQPQAQRPASTGAGLTDEELQERNLPPLRGPWVRVQREPAPHQPPRRGGDAVALHRERLQRLAGRRRPLNYRSGDLGYDHLSALEAPFEASMPLGYNGGSPSSPSRYFSTPDRPTATASSPFRSPPRRGPSWFPFRSPSEP
jgi:hypothetical protein